jgi:predicted trehalose synthase
MTPHPGVELLVHLESRGFGAMPRFLGVEQRDGLVLALATEYVPGAQDGWDWFVDDVDSWLRGSLAPADVIAGATRMGALTAQLHAALADLQPAAVAARTYHVQATERLDGWWAAMKARACATWRPPCCARWPRWMAVRCWPHIGCTATCTPGSSCARGTGC